MMSKNLDNYVRHAIEHGHFTLEGDAEATNNAYDCLQQAFEAIMKEEEGDSLFDLYEHIDPWVQAWAASHTLEINEAKALAKLEKLEKADIPLVSMTAEYTIKGWNAGELRFLRS